MSGYVVAAYQRSWVMTLSGPRPLAALPCYFAPDRSVPPLPGFGVEAVADGGLADAALLGLPEVARGRPGTLMIPMHASAWLQLDGCAASHQALIGEVRAAFRAYVAEAGACLHLARGQVSLARPLVMGVVNVTPDSFSDGGRYVAPERAVAHGLELAEAGADLLDVGGESTRPGSAAVSLDEELDRVVPVVAELAARSGVLVSVDTRKSKVARAALAAGAALVNDVSALRDDPHMLEVVRDHAAGLVLMHMRGEPGTMQRRTHYDDLFGEITEHLEASLALAYDGGIDLRGVLVDPGIGFGKGLDENLELVGRLGRLWALGRPLLLGTSRKRFLGELTGRAVEQREFATVAAVAAGVLAGASMVRVHDAGAGLDAVRVASALRGRITDGV